MAGFFFRHYLQLRSQIILGRGLGDLRARLARNRRVNRREMRSLRASQVAAAEMVDQNRIIREDLELQFVTNMRTDLWVYEYLAEVENDPLMRDNLARIIAQNLQRRNVNNMNRFRPFPGRRRRQSSP